MALSAQIGYIMPQEYKIYNVGPGGQEKPHHKPIKEYTEPRIS